MDAWIALSVAAAAFQTLRFMLQKQLSTATLSAGGATFSRFFYSTPIILSLTTGYLFWQNASLPSLSLAFFLYAFAGGLTQILATWCVVALFQQRNFAVGITLKKTEVLQTALVGFIVLGDPVSLTGFLAILTGFLGVLFLSRKNGPATGRLLGSYLNRGTALGLLSGVFFAVSAVGYRGATLEIQSDDALLRSSVTLSLVTLGQTAGMALWLIRREAGEITRVIAARKTALWIGLSGMAGSLCWFTAFTLHNAAYVFAVGQVEVIFSIAASALFFHEKITRLEFIGIAFITLSVVALVFAV
ncbi:DMT family transporter [Kiloniella sp. b19]|uniref:DMT family transporter n=1 Tax=Kiloniella sp. GXU_MW_B19 TaxID=3141326 RepID=UPI0031DB0DDF